jgi:hypothetical protein
VRWLGFRIFNKTAAEQGVTFAVRESQAVESVPFSGVMPPKPGSPGNNGALLGNLTYQGRAIRVYDLGIALGFGPCNFPQRARLLVARQSRVATPLAIAVQPELEELTSLEAPGIRLVDLKALGRVGRPPR